MGGVILISAATVWGERKNLADYIALGKLLPEDYLIVLVGLQEDVIATLPKNVVGIERTQNQSELATLYSRADILLSLSSAETFGLTMAEAYACGTPVIVYDNTAQPEIVVPETGRVVKTGDVQDVADAIKKMVESDFKKNQSQFCRRRAIEHYDKNKCFEHYVELYENLTK